MVEPKRRRLAARAAAAILALLGSSPRIVLADVELRGIEDPELTNVLVHLELDDVSCESEFRQVERAFEQAPDDIRFGLEAYGYYAARIDGRLNLGPDCWAAVFEIELGPRILLRTVRIEVNGMAATDPEFVSAIESSGVEPGQPLLHASYEQLKSQLQLLAQQRGYVDAAFTANRIDVYPDSNAADIEIMFDSGDRYSFGDVVLDQQVLSDSLVLAYKGFDEGDYYDEDELSSFQTELRNSGYFESITITPLAPRRDLKQIPIVVSLVGAPRRFLTYGIGLSTDTGVRLKFGRNIRRWNERGHQLNLNVQLSPVVSEVSANYRLPYGDPRREWLSFDTGIIREKTDTSETEGLEFGVRRVLQLNELWSQTQLVSLIVEDFEVADQTDRSRLLMPGVEWSRLDADNRLRPTNGSKLDLELRAAADRFGSDTSFVQLLTDIKWIRTVQSDDRILMRAQLGGTLEKSFRELPPSVRFFAGGDNSVRGYDFETLGPVNEDGEVIGGSRIFTASIEYERAVRERWSVAFFADTGNAFDDSNIDLHTGIGIGARWQSPLGPIRIDIARPLDGLDRDLRLHINLGPDL